MKIKAAHLEQIETAFTQLADKIPAHREAVHASGKFTDLEKRVRWDVLNASLGCKWVCENIYPYANDEHLDTALRATVRKLGL